MKFKLDVTQAESKTTFEFASAEMAIAVQLFQNIAAMALTDSCVLWAIDETGNPLRLVDEQELKKAITAARFNPANGGQSGIFRS